jgi:hypothetical protein
MGKASADIQYYLDGGRHQLIFSIISMGKALADIQSIPMGKASADIHYYLGGKGNS